MTPMHAIWLIEHGVGLGQGFLFSKPLSPEDFHEYFAAQRTRTLAAA
jgi:sensor c-di-GMP phosphodiesterase-like protein